MQSFFAFSAPRVVDIDDHTRYPGIPILSHAINASRDRAAAPARTALEAG